MPILLLTSCWDGPWTDIRDVEYRSQVSSNYCGIACVQMWSLYDGRPEISQDEIFDSIDSTSSHGGYIWPEDIAQGVNLHTESYGYFQLEGAAEIHQDACIASSIAAIKDFRLAIMPFLWGKHAVLVTGYKWHYENGKRVADLMFYHDPDNKPFRQVTAYNLKSLYFNLPSYERGYWVIVGRRKHVNDGWDGYMQFLQDGGTYYGGPSIYYPEI